MTSKLTEVSALPARSAPILVPAEHTATAGGNQTMRKFVEKFKRSWAFAIAAASLPLSYILLFPCLGPGCAGCPTGGACLLSAPFLIVLVVVGKSFVKIKNSIQKLTNSNKENVKLPAPKIDKPKENIRGQ